MSNPPFVWNSRSAAKDSKAFLLICGPTGLVELDRICYLVGGSPFVVAATQQTIREW